LAVNRTGAAIWELLIAGTTEQGLTARISDEFGIRQEAASRDVRAFLSQLARQDLLEP